jgi:XTP/dITP diphosphohydrolase
MHRLPVDSTDIVSVGYDEKTRVLEIEFHGDRVYQYREVEPSVYQHFMKAESHGLFFNSSINGRYRYKRVDASDDRDRSAAVAFVTGNWRKFRDLEQVCETFSIAVEQLDLPVDEIQSADPLDIATKKAKAAYHLAGDRPVLVQDAFWNILALRGFPGAYMAEVTRWFRAEDFLRLMDGKSDRTIYCKDTLVYYDGKRTKVFSHDYHGRVATEARGKGHFAIDEVVIMDGTDRTIAEVEEQGTRSSAPAEETVWNDFAKWYALQRKLRLV